MNMPVVYAIIFCLVCGEEYERPGVYADGITDDDRICPICGIGETEVQRWEQREA